MLEPLAIMRISSLILIVHVVGCAHAELPPAASQPSIPTPVLASPADPAAVASVPAVVTGVLQRRGQQIEICPVQTLGPCAGIVVSGHVDEACVSTAGAPSVCRVTGTFDGATLQVTAPAQLTDFASSTVYRNACPEYQQPVSGSNPDERLSGQVEAFGLKHAERVAGQWWDAEYQTMVVSVTGDAAELQTQFRELAPKARVCIQGGARFSHPALEIARQRADLVLAKHRIAWSSSSIDVVRNRVMYDAEVIDAATLAELAQEAGESVHVVAFIELPEHRKDQLPTPAARGDVPLVTEKTRSAASMQALGRFYLRYDSVLRCMYLQNADGERLLPVWPFGYWATSSPARIYDFDDRVVGEGGASLELGGGEVDIQHVYTANTCDAKRAWIGRPNAPAR